MIRARLTLTLLLGYAQSARAEDPAVVLQSVLDDLSSLWVPLNQDPTASYDSRRAWTVNLVNQRFDFPHMSRSSLGSRWNRLSDQEREAYRALFRPALIENVIDWLDAYVDQNFEIKSVRPSGRNTEIITRFTQVNGITVTVTWVTRETSGIFLFRDVRVAGLSLIADFRGKYRQLIEREGFERFLEILAEDTAELRAQQS